MTDFAQRYAAALADPNIQDGLLAFQRDWRTARDTQIGELEDLTGRSFQELAGSFNTTKAATRARWEQLTSEFEDHAESAGIVIHRAATADDACTTIEEILRARRIDRVVKTKSMATEEIYLNRHLEAAGITPVETDLGEWLLQLVDEHPSHLVLPAIHKRRHQIGRILEDALGQPFDPDDVTAMVRAARTALRASFFAAGAGISGANALIASTGSLLLVTNEGNATLATTIPDVHIVVAGLDKLIPDTRTAVDQLRLLGRSATGQRITSYTSVLSGPRPGQELHIVLVDNGRSVIAGDDAFADALSCIRCGACADVCPPYQVVGGHVFGHVYTGAIGLVTTPFHHGLDHIAEAQSLCVSCNACTSVCPADIPLASQILRVRSRVFDAKASRAKKLALRAFESRRMVAVGTTLAATLSAPFRKDGHLRIPVPGRHGWRRAPAIPIRPARRRGLDHAVAVERYDSDVTDRRVALFMQCVTDRLAPRIAEATAGIIARAGGIVEVPEQQHCCGLPAFDTGDWARARRMLTQTLDVFDGYDHIVTPAPSCLAALAHEYAPLAENDDELGARLERLSASLVDVAGFLDGPGRPPDGTRFGTGATPRVGVHRFCQCSNVLGRDDRLERLLAQLTTATVVPIAEAEVCCGFGGSSSIAAPEVSATIAERKLANIDAARVDIVVADNPGCILHLRGAIAARGDGPPVLHLAEFLAAGSG